VTSTSDRSIRRVVVSHALAAVGMSLPWPLLVLLVWERAGDGWVLGLAGAARMLPYVALSWAAGRLADRFARDLIVTFTLIARTALLVLVAASVAMGETWVALGAATLAIAVATPAYPALAAAMPSLAGLGRQRAERATGWLVTCEVASFVVGPALGGVLLAPATRGVVAWLAALCVAGAWLLFVGVRLPAPGVVATRAAAGVLAALRGSSVLRGTVAAVAVVNAVCASVGLALLPLAASWEPGDSGTAFGIATGALGFGAVGGPLLGRVGRRWEPGGRTWLLVLAAALTAVAWAPDLWVAVPLLGLAGATAVRLEIVATATVQLCAPDRLRASLLGATDTAMVAAALLGALFAPALAVLLGPVAVILLGAGSSVCAVALVRRPEVAEETVREPESLAA
jgi:MFS family permease